MKGQLKRYINSSARVHRHLAVIHKGLVFWYSPKDRVLITVIPLKQRWHKYVTNKDGDA